LLQQVDKHGDNCYKNIIKTQNQFGSYIIKKQSNKPSISYNDALDEALCLGWIDSKVKSIDQDSYMQFFTKHKATSVWSKINKAKVEHLIQIGQMTQAGLYIIEKAKHNGLWTILDEVEALIPPADLEQAF